MDWGVSQGGFLVARSRREFSRESTGMEATVRFQCQIFSKFQKRGDRNPGLAFLHPARTLHYPVESEGILWGSVDLDRAECVSRSFFGQLGDVLWTTCLPFIVVHPIEIFGFLPIGNLRLCNRQTPRRRCPFVPWIGPESKPDSGRLERIRSAVGLVRVSWF